MTGEMKTLYVGKLIVAIIIPLSVGTLSAMISAKNMMDYKNTEKPVFSPPGWVFSIAWTILYILMGISSYYVIVEETNYGKEMALTLYTIQLVMNFFWSIIFFNLGKYLLAFVWILIMWGLVVACAIRFYSISRISGYLMIPYIIWTMFAAYLNYGAYNLHIKSNA